MKLIELYLRLKTSMFSPLGFVYLGMLIFKQLELSLREISFIWLVNALSPKKVSLLAVEPLSKIF